VYFRRSQAQKEESGLKKKKRAPSTIKAVMKEVIKRRKASRCSGVGRLGTSSYVENTIHYSEIK